MWLFFRDPSHLSALLQARQTGKTFNGMAKLLWYNFRYPDSKILGTAPKFDQVKNVAFRALREHLNRISEDSYRMKKDTSPIIQNILILIIISPIRMRRSLRPYGRMTKLWISSNPTTFLERGVTSFDSSISDTVDPVPVKLDIPDHGLDVDKLDLTPTATDPKPLKIRETINPKDSLGK